MKVLLTGATGFLGFRTLEKLVQEPSVDLVVANGRTLLSSHTVDHPKANYKLGSLSDPQLVNQLVKDTDCIIHAAALSSPFGNYKQFEEANVLSQKNLIAAATAFGVKKYVYVSTPSVYFEYKDKFNIKESDPLPEKMVNSYARTKYQAEQLLEHSDLEYVTIRPRALIGRGDRVILPRLIRAHNEGRLKIIGDGHNSVDVTPVSNVVDAILLAMRAQDNAVCQTYNISNGQPVQLWELIHTLLEELDLIPPTSKVPFGLVRSIAAVQESWAKLVSKKEPSLTQYGVGVLAKSHTLDISKAKELLGYQPQMSVEEAIQEFIKWYKNES